MTTTLVATCSPPGDGDRLKRRALELLAAWRERYIVRGRRVLLITLLERGTASADDVRNAVPLPPNINPKCFGAVPGELARARIIARAGFGVTGRAVAHARPVSIWRLIDADAARAWLAEHPEPQIESFIDPDKKAPADADTPAGQN